jgi:hypothetical protein
MTAKFINQGIALYENGLSDALCNEIWDFYFTNLDKSTPGVTMSGHSVGLDGEIWKNTLDQDVHKNFTNNNDIIEQRKIIDEKIYQELKPAISDYLSNFEYLATAPNIEDTSYLWQMYKQNDGFYKEHIDGEQWSYNVYNRVGAILCYINTVEEGGETYFRYQDLKVKPVKGSVVVFPTSWMYPHEAMMPLSSNKLILSSFLICNPVEYHVHKAE